MRIKGSWGAKNNMLRQSSNTTLSDFYKTQIHDSFKKLKIVDNSINKNKMEIEILDYFRAKFEAEISAGYNYDFIDLFCGAGGLSTGIEQEGFRPSIAVDKDKSALLTYQFNRPWLDSKSIINEDIRELVGQQVFDFVPVIVGGPPCQGFSVANQHKKECDERNELYKFYVHAVDQAKPDIFLIENVEGILKLYKDIQSDFAKIGFHTCQPIVLNTRDFGFPQSRKRAFILGINSKYETIAEELYGIFTSTIREHETGISFTLRDAISDLPVLSAKTAKNATYSESAAWGYTYGGFRKATSEYAKLVNPMASAALPLLNHRPKYNNDRDIKIFELLRPGEKSDAESIKDINPYLNRADMFKDKFDKLVYDEPCKTITAHMYYDCNMYIHPTQARGLTPREAARVQGFPDDYLFLGSPNEWYRQIGNAVSPLIARVLAKGLRGVLERIYRQ